MNISKHEHNLDAYWTVMGRELEINASTYHQLYLMFLSAQVDTDAEIVTTERVEFKPVYMLSEALKPFEADIIYATVVGSVAYEAAIRGQSDYDGCILLTSDHQKEQINSCLDQLCHSHNLTNNILVYSLPGWVDEAEQCIRNKMFGDQRVTYQEMQLTRVFMMLNDGRPVAGTRTQFNQTAQAQMFTTIAQIVPNQDFAYFIDGIRASVIGRIPQYLQRKQLSEEFLHEVLQKLKQTVTQLFILAGHLSMTHLEQYIDDLQQQINVVQQLSQSTANGNTLSVPAAIQLSANTPGHHS